MTPLNIGMMIAIPVSLMVVIGLVLLSGSLPSVWRRRIERALLVVFYPLMILFWAWRAVDEGLGRDWISAAIATAVSLGMLGLAVKTACKPQRADGTRT